VLIGDETVGASVAATPNTPLPWDPDPSLGAAVGVGVLDSKIVTLIIEYISDGLLIIGTKVALNRSVGRP
jgi:hypothetical protein